MKVELSQKALADLRLIARWIEADSPEQARLFVDQLRRKCAGLSRSAKRFPVVRVIGAVEVHKRTHGRYLIFYVVGRSRVDILRILHGARDWASMLEDDLSR